jgi:hypothetical protein
MLSFWTTRPTKISQIDRELEKKIEIQILLAGKCYYSVLLLLIN